MILRARDIPELKNKDRFFKKIKIDPDTGCWNWLSSTIKNGYGTFGIGGKPFLAHRVSYHLAGKELDPFKVLDHRCKNRICVNPKHLNQVSRKENNTENSAGMGALNKYKTHCNNGHAFTKENTTNKVYVTKRDNKKHKVRVCKICKANTDAKYYKNKKEKI